MIEGIIFIIFWLGAWGVFFVLATLGIMSLSSETIPMSVEEIEEGLEFNRQLVVTGKSFGVWVLVFLVMIPLMKFYNIPKPQAFIVAMIECLMLYPLLLIIDRFSREASHLIRTSDVTQEDPQ